MPLNGVKTTGIIHRPVLCRLLLTGNVRTVNLITRVVKKTGRELVVNKVMSILVLRDGCINRQTVVRGIILTVNAVPLRRRQVVRPITRSPVILPVDHREPIPAVIPVTAAVPTLVRPEHLRIIMVLTAEGLSADLPVIVVRTVHPAADLIPALMLGLPSVEAAMLVPIPAAQVRNPYLALPIM